MLYGNINAINESLVFFVCVHVYICVCVCVCLYICKIYLNIHACVLLTNMLGFFLEQLLCLQNGTVEEVKKIVNVLNAGDVPSSDIVGKYHLLAFLVLHESDFG
mgnify:CR=1 FL=1